MHLELTDEQTEALIRELSQLIDGDRYPLSPGAGAGRAATGEGAACGVRLFLRAIKNGRGVRPALIASTRSL